ncbi:MAG: hypothetical protein B6D41_11485 [Chloroflexi bacterium UTCFX4]|jgi:WD40 repeat protein|nr:MAG: hypothetical protein B6D41_11485 [Chloroflexi bacterium UTCFX4]
MSNLRPNPYVGPRPFQTGEKMYGRERETRELLNLLIAERIVLLYSPSGAGKTSLIQAALFPKLREEEFVVLPTMRVNSEPPVIDKNETRATFNRYALSTLLSLEEAQPREKRLSLTQLAGLTFHEYLKQRADLQDKNPVLLFDQFEEIITTAPMERDAKFLFFEQIGEALRDRSRWALFSMREDYIAGLDPYIRPLPTRFSTRYRLDVLNTDAAREAIQQPARDAGVTFTDSAAQKLINDLRQVHIQRPDGTMETQPGLYVEPVQLQVVCLRLWNNLGANDTEISESDIAQVGDVNSALASYYALRVSAVASATNESERAIREWFDRQLITEQGIRGQVLMEPERSRGLSNAAIRMLVDAHLVRADERRGATWYELAHDRLIEPLRSNNATWFQENLSAFQQQADLWERQERPDGLLLRGKAWDEGYLWAQQHATELTPVEQAFFKESDQEHFRMEKERRTQSRIRYLAFGATILSVIAILGIIVALIALAQLGSSLQETDEARAEAIAKGDEANSARLQAQQQERVTKMTNAALSQLNVDPETSLLLAMQAYSTTQSAQTDDILRQAVIESRVRGTLRGHTDSVDSVAISPDGKLFATASGDSTAILWDAARGKQVYVLKGHTAPVWGIAFSPDGKTVLTTSADNTARLWDLTKCNGDTCPAREIKGHSAPVWGGAFSPNGEVFATVGEDGIAKLWETETGQFLGDLDTHAQGINAVAFSPDGKYFATASSDQTAQVTDLTACDNGKCSVQPFETQAALWSVAFSPDSKYMVVASDDQNAYKINLAANSIENQLSGHSDSVLSVAYSPDGKYIATGSRDGTARVWDANTGQTIAILRGHDNSVWSVAFTPDSRLLLTGSADTTARVWDISDNDAQRVLRGTLNKALGAAYSGDGKRVISTGADSVARVWDAATSALIEKLVGHKGWVSDGALNRDGTRAATSSFDGTARIWDLTNCAPDCSFIELKGHEGIVRSIAYSPDDKFVLTASDDRTARVWDATTGALVKTLTGHEGEVYHASFSRDGKWIVTTGNDRVAIIWDATTGEQKFVLRGHTSAVNNASFNANATLVVTASDDRTARIWDIADCAPNSSCPFKELKGHLGAVTGAVFTHDGKNIVTSSADKTARVWDANTLETVSILRGHTDKVQTVETSPDDQFVLTASSDKTVRIVPLAIQKVLELARLRVTRALTCDEWAFNLGDPNYCPGGGITQNANPLPTLAPITRIAIVSPTESAPTTPTAHATVDLAKPSVTSESVMPTATATIQKNAPTASVENTAAPTLPVLATAPAATPTPKLAPGVYVSRIVYQPLDAPNFQFKVTFVNTTGAPVTYTNWRVPFFDPGAKNSTGAPKGLAKTIPVGVTELVTEVWKVGVGQCTPYTARPVSEDGEGRQTQFIAPDGQPVALDFQICPP